MSEKYINKPKTRKYKIPEESLFEGAFKDALNDFEKLKKEIDRLDSRNVPFTKTEHEAIELDNYCSKMIRQFESKNEAYGDSFGKTFQKYGPISGLTRLGDKFGRVEALILGAKNNVPDESIEDTLTDLACYALMIRYELEVMKRDKELQRTSEGESS